MTDFTNILVKSGASLAVNAVQHTLTNKDIGRCATSVAALAGRDALQQGFDIDEAATYIATNLSASLLMGPARRKFTRLSDGDMEILAYGVAVWGLSYSMRTAGVFPPGTLQSTAVDAVISAGARYGFDQVMQ